MDLARDRYRDDKVGYLQVLDRELTAENGWHLEGKDLIGAGHESRFGRGMDQSCPQVFVLCLVSVDVGPERCSVGPHAVELSPERVQELERSVLALQEDITEAARESWLHSG